MTTTPLELRHRQVGPWPMNTYALICPATGASVLFDPGADPDAARLKLKLSRTHCPLEASRVTCRN